MLPAEKSNILQTESGNLSFTFFPQDMGMSCKYQHLYITSNDEIKEGDWVYNIVQKTYFKADKNFMKIVGNTLTTNKKIIATTDKSLTTYVEDKDNLYDPRSKTGFEPYYKLLPQPNKAFIEEYCELGGIDEVIVEYEFNFELTSFTNKMNPDKGWEKWSNKEYVLKVNSQNEITIHPIKDTWTREELIKIIHNHAKYSRRCSGIQGEYSPKWVDDWIQQNL